MAHIPTGQELSNFLDKIDTEARRWVEVWSSNWDRNADLLRNRRKSWEPAPVFSARLTIPAVLRKANLLVECKPTMDVKPRKNGFQKSANVLKHAIMAGWDEQGVQMELEMLAMYVECFGCGYFGIDYDPDDAGIHVRAIDPRLMKVDPAVVKAYQLAKAQYVIEQQIVPLGWVHKRFPERAKEVDADSHLNLAAASDETFHKISWYQRILGRMTQQAVDYGAIPRVVLNTYWIVDDEGDGGYRRIFRTGDGIILNPNPKKQSNPYFDQMHPYEMLDSEADMDAPFGHSEVERLAKIDEPFNRITNLYAKNMLRNVPWIIADANALDQETLQDLKEREEVVVEKSAGRNVERTPAPAPAAAELQFLEMLKGLVDEFTGTKEGGMPGGGKGRVEVRSEPQLQGLQMQGMTLIRGQARRLEAFLERVGSKWISRLFQFIPDDQIMVYIDGDELKEFDFQKSHLMEEIIKDAHATAAAKQANYINEELEDGRKLSERLLKEAPEGEADAEAILDATKQAWRKFRFKIVPGSSLIQVKLQRAALLEQLAQQGRIPGSMVVEEAGFDNPEELEALALKEMQHRQQMGFPPPGDAGKDKNKGKKK